MEDIRKHALDLYKPPFRFYNGYIHDSNGNMVSDDDEVDKGIIQRIRGWGRIGYMPNAEALQDEVGQIIVEALNEFWNKGRN